MGARKHATPKPQKNGEITARLREIPSVDQVLSRPRLVALAASAGRAVVTQAARRVLGELRTRLIKGMDGPSGLVDITGEQIEARIVADVETLLATSLRRVINATGVVLHTNLGRAPLALPAVEAIAESAPRYSNLEYDIESGQRGKRDVHTAGLLADLREPKRPSSSTTMPPRSFSS